MKTATLFIGQLAQQAKCKVETVHYYEKIKLMPAPPRSNGGHRIYSLSHVKRLNFIRRSRELGFSIQQIQALLKLMDEPNHCCGEVKKVAMQHATKVQQKIDDLIRLKSAIDNIVNRCTENDSSIEYCPIIDALYVENIPD